MARRLPITVLLLLSLVACGSSDPEPTSAEQQGGAGFPVTVEHLFGPTKVEKKPERIVTLGGGDMEAATALGVVPIAGADWFGYTETRDWVKTALGDRPAPELIQASEPNFEKIAALRPDLILYVNSINDRKTYEKLSEIAPTIAAPPGTKNVYGARWQDQVKLIAQATGVSPDEVIAKTEQQLTDAAEANPEFAGKTITVGVFSSGRFSAWLPSDPRMRLLTALGFKVNPKIAALDNGDFFVFLSNEQLGLMDADVILLAAEDQNGKVDPSATGNPVYKGLSAVRDGHAVYFGGAPVIMSNSGRGAFSSAFSIGGPLGIPYALSKLVPMLKPAV